MRRLHAGFVAALLAAVLAAGCGGGSDKCKSDADCGGVACCNGACVDLTLDEANCGACGTACGAGGTCCASACVNTQTSASNCGTCGTVCSAANGTPACAGGACGIASCNAGFGNCDATVSNGCETDTNTTVAHCGACNAACSVANGTPACTGGACGIASCNAGFGDCDATASNGCETDTNTTLAHCGACNVACSVANGTPACTGGACGISSCNAGFGDCNAAAGDGCEVNTATSVANCGACGTVCATPPNGTAGCSSSVCGIASCNAPYRNCDGQTANGCEVNTGSDVNNCGNCGTVCVAPPNGTRGCSAGACGVASCNAGWGNCDGVAGNGCEVNTTNSVTNCGACGTVCSMANATSMCSASACAIASCNAGFANCDGSAANGCEVNTTSDSANCGACGNACGAGAVCSAGVCKDRVLVVGAPATATWNNDVQAKIASTGAFATVDVFNGATGTPTLAQLQQYKAVLVYSDAGFANAVALGDNLASYYDAGGRVVTAVFATATVPIQGRWQSGGYGLINPAGQAQPAEAGALQILDGSSSLVTGVASLTATAAFRSPGGPINGGVTVANWGSGAPLIVRGQKNGRARADLNFYPVSSAMRADFWVGSGAVIMKNALAYLGYCHSIVGTGGNTCPSGKTQFCDPNPISATSAAQAKTACDTCYGLSCFLETADCAGAAYGPKPAGQYVPNEAYFGYAVGCSGAAGRIWPITNSYTTLGRWAP